jgi:signal transduction histidine kinase
MLSLSEEQGGEGFAEISVRSAVSEALQLVSTRLEDASIELTQAMSQEVPEVLGNRAQLIQVLVHLFNNAITAMDAGGTLTVRTRLIEEELVEIKVIDTGRGIPKEHRERVFEPFFTTKEEWQGRGLGLSVAFRIIEQHNGSIVIDSELEKGTEVTVTLPIAKGGAHLV